MAFRCLLGTPHSGFCFRTAFGAKILQNSFQPTRHLQVISSKQQCLLGKRDCQVLALRSYITGRYPLAMTDRIHNRKSIPSSQINLKNTRTFIEDRKTKSLTIFQDLKHLKSSPVPALVLGFSGLLPFLLAPAYIISCNAFIGSVAVCQVAYGATILSFLGGVRWGITLTEESGVRPSWFNLGYSVTPPLVAWLGLMMPNIILSNLILIGGLAGAAYLDTVMWGYPPWFRALRFMLSFIAILSLWTTLMCKLILRDAEVADKNEPVGD